MSAVAEHYPRDYALNHEKLEYFSNKLFARDKPVYSTPSHFEFPNVTQDMTDWVSEYATAPLIDPKVKQTTPKPSICVYF